MVAYIENLKECARELLELTVNLVHRWAKETLTRSRYDVARAFVSLMEAREQIDIKETTVAGAPKGRLKKSRELLRAETAGSKDGIQRRLCRATSKNDPLS